MASGSFNWFVAVPAERQNLLSNPSFEIGTAGWSGTGTPALGTVTAAQAFGAWALTATGAADGLGITAATPTLGSGSAVTASAYVMITGASGGSAQIGVGGTAYRTPVGSSWQRIAVGTLQTAGATRTVAVQRFSAAGGTLWVDGCQAEYGSITTYLDGDQDGCQWLGNPHASQSWRSGQSRAGGSVMPLNVLGLRAETSPGIGMPPVVNLAQQRAMLDGAEYQRTRADVREFTITATVTGTTLEDLHTTRRRLIDALSVSRTTPQAPTRFYYTGAGGTVTIDAVYAGGLERNNPESAISDLVEARFTAHEPLWRGVTDQGTALAPYTALGSVNYIAYRDPRGQWGTLGANGTTVLDSLGGAPIVSALFADAGTLFVGGNFNTAGGTIAPYIAQWANGAWGTLVGGTLANAAIWGVNAILVNPAGTLFAGGGFGTASGTAVGGLAAYVNGAWGTLPGGTPTGFTFALALDPATGGIYAGGSYAGVAGTAGARFIARWNGQWGTLVGGTLHGVVQEIRVFSGTVFVAGDLRTAGGTTIYGLAQWAGNAWGSIVGAVPAMGSIYSAMDIGKDQRVYAAGLYSGPLVMRSGGAGTLAGLTYGAPGAARAALTMPDGDIIFGGYNFQLYGGSIPLTIDLVRWNGYSWIPPDIRILTNTSSDSIEALEVDRQGTLYVGGYFDGPGTAAFVAPVVNTGMSEAYPVLRVRNTGSGTARIYQLLNTTTGDDLYLDLVAQPGEYLTIDMTPGRRAITSATRGNLISSVLGGSNLATWRLLPGTNWISFFSDGAGVRADLYFRPRHWSADGGAGATL